MKHILILGGRTGLGRAIAESHLANGDVMSTVGRHKPVFDGNAHKWLLSNFLRDDDVDVLEDHVRNATYDRVYVCTGRFLKRPIERVTQREIDEVTRVNYTVPARLIVASLAGMSREQNDGHIVVVGSTTGDDAKAEESVYGASKSALMNFTRSIGRQKRTRGIRLTLFVPGGMKSELFYEGYDEVDQRQFMDPAKVTPLLLDFIEKQSQPFDELKLVRADHPELW